MHFALQCFYAGDISTTRAVTRVKQSARRSVAKVCDLVRVRSNANAATSTMEMMVMTRENIGEATQQGQVVLCVAPRNGYSQPPLRSSVTPKKLNVAHLVEKRQRALPLVLVGNRNRHRHHVQRIAVEH